VKFIKICSNLPSWIKRLDFIFLVIAVPIVAIFIAIIPPSWGLDEQVHTARVYQITDDGMYPTSIGNPHAYGGYISGNLRNVIENGWKSGNNVTGADIHRGEIFYATGRNDSKYDVKKDGLGALPINGGGKVVYAFGATAPYAPVVYLPAAAGMGVGRLFNASVNTSLVLSKVGQAIFYLGCIYVALRLLNNSKAKWVIFCVALFPEAIFQVATINADVYTNGMVLVFAATIVRLLQTKALLSRKLNAVLWMTSIGLMFTKPSYALAIVLVILLPASLYKSTKQMNSQKLSILVACFILFILISAKGLQYSDAILMYFTPEKASQISLVGQIGYIFQQPLEFIITLARTVIVNSYEWQSGMLGTLGYNVVQIPYILTVPLIASTFVAALYGRILTKLRAAAFIMVGILSALTVLLLLYGTFNTIGASMIAGVQGRYYIPSIIFILLGLAPIVGIQIKASKSSFAIPALIIGCVTFTLYSSVIVYSMALF